jgi:hypothetical protein
MVERDYYYEIFEDDWPNSMGLTNHGSYQSWDEAAATWDKLIANADLGSQWRLVKLSHIDRNYGEAIYEITVEPGMRDAHALPRSVAPRSISGYAGTGQTINSQHDFDLAVLGLILAGVLLVASLVAGIFSVWWGGMIYVAGIYLAAATVVFSFACIRPPNDPTGARRIILSSDEERLFRKYYPFFRYPAGTKSWAHFITFARAFGIVWIVIGLWQRMYWVAVANAVFYLISVWLLWRLHPISHYNALVEKGHASAAVELRMMQHILDSRDELGF